MRLNEDVMHGDDPYTSQVHPRDFSMKESIWTYEKNQIAEAARLLCWRRDGGSIDIPASIWNSQSWKEGKAMGNVTMRNQEEGFKKKVQPRILEHSRISPIYFCGLHLTNRLRETWLQYRRLEKEERKEKTSTQRRDSKPGWAHPCNRLSGERQRRWNKRMYFYQAAPPKAGWYCIIIIISISSSFWNVVK